MWMSKKGFEFNGRSLHDGLDSFDGFVRSEKVPNDKSPNVLNVYHELCPERCSEFSPNSLKDFCALFSQKRRPQKNHPKSPPFSMPNPQAHLEK